MYCIKWGTPIPLFNEPYGVGWTAHEKCSPHDHGFFISQFGAEALTDQDWQKIQEAEKIAMLASLKANAPQVGGS